MTHGGAPSSQPEEYANTPPELIKKSAATPGMLEGNG